MTRIYLAAPLFSQAERSFNIELCSALSVFANVFLPQRDGHLMTELISRGLSPEDAKREVFSADVSAIRQCDLLIAVLDGSSVDEGVAVELALAFAWGKTCWSLKTDFRSLAAFGENPMIEGLLDKQFTTVDSLLTHISNDKLTCNHG